MNIRPVRLPDEVPAVRELFCEYAAGLGFSLCFQNFDAELAGLPGAYAPPAGRLLVAEVEGEMVGCVALRPQAAGVCELKRLYVRPAYRGKGIGRRLLEMLLAEAVDAGYLEAVFDTLESMTEALALYRSFAFEPTEPYGCHPVAGSLCFRKKLQV
ncbi:MAG TPA: GNAT family N-acetyltransferase [Gemmataceae bacterium]|nr:GNAT family N-acetyltransferase [Gemmataceae bacterium]